MIRTLYVQMHIVYLNTYINCSLPEIDPLLIWLSGLNVMKPLFGPTVAH